MQRSKVLKAVALRKLEHNWHTQFKLGAVKLLLKKLQRKIDTLNPILHITRTYAHKVKSDGTLTYRPIGNPRYEDRMFLYLLQSFFTVYLYSYIGKYQHGFLPGRGTLTAWKAIKPLLKLPYIYEYDLKGAFPSIRINYVIDRLIALGLPSPVGNFIHDMSHLSIPSLDRDTQMLAEPKIDMFQNSFLFKGQNIGNNQPNPEDMLSGAFLDALFEHDSVHNPEIMSDPFAVDRARSGDKSKEYIKAVSTGFPEGSGLSPILFDFAFEEAINRGTLKELYPNSQLVAYADDFIIFSTEALKDFTYRSDEMIKAGLEFSIEKCRILKSELWQVPSFKFLGITHYTESGMTSGTPKSGTVLPYDKELAIQKFNLRDAQIQKFINVLHLECSRDDALASWGRSEFPFDLIPDSVIMGESILDEQTLATIQKIIANRGSLKDRPEKVTGSGARSFARARALVKTRSSDWIASRKAGLIQSRLYAGTWLPASDASTTFDLAKSVHPRTEGRSWFDLMKNKQLIRHAVRPNLHNSTSLAMDDLLALLRDPKAIKLAKGDAKYSLALIRHSMQVLRTHNLPD